MARGFLTPGCAPEGAEQSLFPQPRPNRDFRPRARSIEGPDQAVHPRAPRNSGHRCRSERTSGGFARPVDPPMTERRMDDAKDCRDRLDSLSGIGPAGRSLQTAELFPEFFVSVVTFCSNSLRFSSRTESEGRSWPAQTSLEQKATKVTKSENRDLSGVWTRQRIVEIGSTAAAAFVPRADHCKGPNCFPNSSFPLLPSVQAP